jgi:SAM-dependent methyltransferase
VSFDRVAHIYDATRGLPPGVVDLIADRIVAATHAGPQTQFLEFGVGTGRIALPLIERGYPYLGVDISEQMMAQLQDKAPAEATNLTLLEANVSDLPLPDDSVDVVLTVHVLHLVPEWKQALKEARRVLRPDGYFVVGQDWSVPGDPGDEIRRQWGTFVEETGTRLRPAYGTERNLKAELTQHGARMSVYRVATWERRFRPIDLLEEQRNRTFSLSWDVPDDVLAAVHERMLAWAKERYGDPERELSARFEFTLSVSRFDEP